MTVDSWESPESFRRRAEEAKRKYEQYMRSFSNHRGGNPAASSKKAKQPCPDCQRLMETWGYQGMCSKAEWHYDRAQKFEKEAALWGSRAYQLEQKRKGKT